MGEVCMMKQVRFHLNFRYEDSVVSHRPPPVFACYQQNGSLFFCLVTVFIRFVHGS